MIIPVGSRVLTKSFVHTGSWVLGTVVYDPMQFTRYKILTTVLGSGTGGMVWRNANEVVQLPESATSEQIQALVHMMGGSLISSLIPSKAK